MSDLGSWIQEEFEKLKTKRDELRVQLDLGKKEVKAAWLEADEKWGELEKKVKLARKLSAQTAEEVKEAAEELAEDARESVSETVEEVSKAAEKLAKEIREGFNRLTGL